MADGFAGFRVSQGRPTLHPAPGWAWQHPAGSTARDARVRSGSGWTPRRPTPTSRARIILIHVDMCATCRYALAMSKMIQLRHVPDELHRRLKARAALAGLSLSDYLLEEVRRTAERPTLADLTARLAQRAPVTPRVPPAKAVRAERERR